MKGCAVRVIAALALATSPASIRACTTAAGYRVPTNFELVRAADLVVIGTLVVETPYGEDANAPEPTLRLKPVRVLKGAVGEAPLLLDGAFEFGRRDRGVMMKMAPNYTALDTVHPNALSGACNRYLFAPDTMVLAMFSRRDGRWQQYSPPFARALEDVPDTQQATWVRAAALYADIARLRTVKQRSALRREQKRLAASAQPGDREIAADMRRTLFRPF